MLRTYCGNGWEVWLASHNGNVLVWWNTTIRLLRAHRSTLRRLDFTTGKRVDREGELTPSKIRKAVALANELERTRRVRGISQVTPLGWLQSRLKMGSSPISNPYIYESARYNYKCTRKGNDSVTSQSPKITRWETSRQTTKGKA